MELKDLKATAYDLGKKLNGLQLEANKIVAELNKINAEIEKETNKEE